MNNLKAIQLSPTHYIIVDDSEIKEGDWVYNPATKEALRASKDMLSWNNDTTQEHKGWKRITHSTSRFEKKAHVVRVSSPEVNPPIRGTRIIPLSVVEDAINGYSVREMAEDSANDSRRRERSNGREGSDDHWMGVIIGYHSGFWAHKELSKDKVFTEADMREALSQSFMASQEGYQITSDEIIKSLLPPTEWDVTFDEQGKLKLV